MKKTSQVAAIWPQIYSKLKSPPPGINLGSFPSKLPPQNQVIFETQSSTENPQAVAYVSSSDTDGNGKIDKIRVVVPRLEQELSKLNISTDVNDPQNLARLLTAFVELLSHEMGHIKDFNPRATDNPFPGGESAAEQASRQALSEFSNESINIQSSFDNSTLNYRSFNMLKVLAELSSLAGKLDAKNQYKFADEVEAIMVDLTKKSSVNKREQGHVTINKELLEDFLRISKKGEFGRAMKWLMALPPFSNLVEWTPTELMELGGTIYYQYRKNEVMLKNRRIDKLDISKEAVWMIYEIQRMAHTVMKNNPRQTQSISEPAASGSATPASNPIAQKTSSSLIALQKELGVKATGKWDTETIAAWELFIDQKATTVLQEEGHPFAGFLLKDEGVEAMKRNWRDVANKLGQTPNWPGMLNFAKKISENLKSIIDVNFERMRDTDVNVGATPDEDVAYTVDQLKASNKKSKIQKEASIGFDTAMDIAFASPQNTPFGR